MTTVNSQTFLFAFSSIKMLCDDVIYCLTVMDVIRALNRVILQTKPNMHVGLLTFALCRMIIYYEFLGL